MTSSIGKNLTLQLFGESHGLAVGATIDGLPAGMKIDENTIRHELTRRRPRDKLTSSRQEQDNFKIISGVYQGFTNGNPLTIIIENKDVIEVNTHYARPSHGDFPNYKKSNGFADLRGGGMASGRLTAPIVAVCSILLDFLKKKNIFISTSLPTDIKKDILSAKEHDDSLGAIVNVKISGLDIGVGEPFFATLEGCLAYAMFAIPGIKGIDFGLGFNMDRMFGSDVNDQFKIQSGEIRLQSNHSGGIEAGLSNGEDVEFRVVFRPTPSINKTQSYLNLKTKEVETIALSGRNDSCIALRGCVVIEALTAFTLCDLLMSQYGSRYFLL